MEALFVADGGRLVPTELAVGPWDPGALHGGPTAAATARAVERHLAADWRIARMTLELLRPVPTDPLLISARTLRPGRKVTLVDVTVTAGVGDGREVARAVVLALRHQPEQMAPSQPGRRLPRPDEVAPTDPPEGAGDWRAFHNEGVEMRWAEGAWRRPGPATVWMRLRVPVVAGEDTTPTMRAAALADFGNGISSELEFGAWRFLNPELTVHLARPPAGEWVCLDAQTVIGGEGAAFAESTLSDRDGVFGRATQSLLIESAG